MIKDSKKYESEEESIRAVKLVLNFRKIAGNILQCIYYYIFYLEMTI
jgi:hypothetical protein